MAALKDVFLNGTQVLQQSASNTNPASSDFNFSDVHFESRLGTVKSNTYMLVFQILKQKLQLGVAVTNGTPVSRSITNSNINAVRVTIGFQCFTKI